MATVESMAKIKAEKWFGLYKNLPRIIMIVIIFLFCVMGVIDASLSGNGILNIKDDGLRLFIWIIIGTFFGVINYFVLKIAVSYRILHIEYLKQINEKLDK